MQRRVATSLVVLGGLLLTGCGEATRDTGGSIGGPAEAVTVQEALRSPGLDPLRVRAGLIVDRRSGAQLCDAMAESYPPQCVDGAPLRGFDDSILPPDTARARGVRWVDTIELIVTSDGQTLTVVREK